MAYGLWLSTKSPTLYCGIESVRRNHNFIITNGLIPSVDDPKKNQIARIGSCESEGSRDNLAPKSKEEMHS